MEIPLKVVILYNILVISDWDYCLFITIEWEKRSFVNILRLIRLPGLFLAISGTLTGFYTAFLTGFGVDATGYLLQVAVCAVCLIFGGAVWNELFSAADRKDNEEKGFIPEVSMSLGYLLGVIFFLAALMLSMTVSLLSFYIVCLYILLSLFLNALLRNVPVFNSMLFALQYVLLVVLGMSAHPYIIFLIIEPEAYIPLVVLFVYILVLGISSDASAKEQQGDNDNITGDIERESLELSTEVDSVYPGELKVDRETDYNLACQLSDQLIQRNMSVILPEKNAVSGFRVNKTGLIAELWLTCLAFVVLLAVPVGLVCMNYSNHIQLVILGILLLFLGGGMIQVLLKKDIHTLWIFYKDGIIAISLINALILASAVVNPYSQEVLTLLGIITGMIVPLLVLRKYFLKLA